MTLRNLDGLLDAGLVETANAPALAAVAERYAIAITPDMARLIDRADPDDPIARQFVPSTDELRGTANEMADPIGDHVHSPVPGIVHRYGDRVLLKVTGVCPVYCRFCFRREMVGPGAPHVSGAALEAALDYIAAHEAIWEVILTGGDPFMLSPRRAGELTRRIATIPHVKTLRWHTRVPVVDPARVSAAFAEAIAPEGKTGWVAIHANHPRELGNDARAAIVRLRQAGLVLVSQSVLLKGVNDNADTLEALFRRLVELGVKPYYLHQADLAPGTGHFRTTIAEGQALMRTLHARLSGLALPTYILDIPGGVSKAPLTPAYLRADDGRLEVRAADGTWRGYEGA